MNSLNAQDLPALQAAFDIPKADYWLDESIRITRASEKPITVVGDWPVIRARLRQTAAGKASQESLGLVGKAPRHAWRDALSAAITRLAQSALMGLVIQLTC